MKEEWKDIIGFEGLYQVSNKGNVINIINNVVLKQGFCKGNYKKVTLFKNGKTKFMQVHRLVAMAFIDNIDNKPQVNHIDGNRQNNVVENLEWVTNKENYYHSVKLGTASRKPKQIAQYSLDGTLVNIYTSMAEAEKINNYSHGNIRRACQGKIRRVYGYVWEYYDNAIAN